MKLSYKNETELIVYEQEIKRIWDNKAAETFMIETAEARGEARGIEKGRTKGKAEEKVAIAQKLLSQNVDINTMSVTTSLSITDINKLKN